MSDTALEVRGLFAGYGRIEALHGIDLRVGQGELVALVGANGAGKTTLLRAVSGLIKASAGSVTLFGREIGRDSADARVRAGLSQVLEGRQVFGPMSVQDNLLLGGYTRPDGRQQRLAEMYALFPVLEEKRLLAAGTLSGGQQQMLAIARALMSEPKVLLLDEPSMGLAPLLVKEIFGVIARLKARGIPILLVEQNAHAALSVADVGYVLETGAIALGGPAAQLLRDERVKAAYLGL
ncbi:ABC transporter ATP-binding protein [Variovorax sp. J22G73]|jgi:branched-chain amino acid transport system ATP-binding protein|uniref:ABC transporter ATP-binding protein n=1 Tax=unclassified Variovorax TaxID=663243 RepID=UPI000D5CB448|nr:MULTISPECIES: ABC transporter ATP-binding protein [unclassified Variovorax]MDM0005459.1 ABC transporter ATP-binding protein [Variovorax sp. J22R203]MDM0099486.1 ABC transporter ATP-binding protein [Variovorax sp. J22G73]